MAKTSNNRATMFFNVAIVLSIFILINLAEGRSTLGSGVQKKNAVVECNSVTGVASGDTCISIAESFSLSTAAFDLINPNLVCTKLFVGQWVCVDGVAS